MRFDMLPSELERADIVLSSTGSPHSIIERDELVAKTGYTRPHTVHCMPGDNIVISMLGDADGNGACGFAVLDARPDVVDAPHARAPASPDWTVEYDDVVFGYHAPADDFEKKDEAKGGEESEDEPGGSE